MKWILAAAIAFFVFIPGIRAEQLSVEKMVNAGTLTAGDSLQVALRFTNPFGKALQIMIVDRDVIGGSGFDIQCFEYQLPENQTITVGYSPIQVLQPGQFTLDKANITYTNPMTGNQEQVLSNSLDITVNQSPNPQSLQQQTVTTIYQCNGVNMQSTSSSYSSGSTSVQTSQGGQNPSIQQQDQDMNALKNQMQQQLQQQEQMKSQLQQKIEQDRGFQDMQKQLEQEGYKPASQSINPESNSTGSFDYSYQNQKGQTAKIAGNVENGEVKNLSEWSEEDAQRLEQLLENSSEFKNLAGRLAMEGFNLSAKSLAEPQNNVSSFQYDYNGSSPASQESITGNITVTGSIVSIKLSGEENPGSWWLIGSILLLVIALAVYLCIRFRRKHKPTFPVHQAQKPLDFRKEALDRIAEAERMFAEGSRKEAYAKASEGVRLYFKHVLHSGRKELTSTDILKDLKKNSDKRYADAKTCFGVCDLVKFAKYTPNEKDFSKAVERGRKAVSE